MLFLRFIVSRALIAHDGLPTERIEKEEREREREREREKEEEEEEEERERERERKREIPISISCFFARSPPFLLGGSSKK